jgi:hypothetical protein
MTITAQADVSSSGGGASAFSAALQHALEKALAGSAGAPVVAIRSGGQGDFAYNYFDANLNFNLWTYQWISALAGPSGDATTAALSGSGSFPAAWAQLLNQLFYRLSNADAQALASAQTAASQEQTNVVLTYAGAFGRITSAQLAAAAPLLGYTPQLFDYIVAYVVGSLWYGQSPPLSYTAMLAAPALAPLLHAIPPGGGPVVAAVQLYLHALGGNVAAIQSAFNAGSALLAQLRAAAASPAAGTTGMTTVDPGGAPSPVVAAYNVGKSAMQIAADLAGSRTISFTFEYQPAAGFSDLGDAPASVLLFTPTGGEAMVMERAAGPVPATILVTYTGYSIVPVAPDVSWYQQSVLAQALANWKLGSAAPSGLTFQSSPLFTLTAFPTGTFNRLRTVIVSNYPTVTITYHGTSQSLFAADLSTVTPGPLSLFGTHFAPSTVPYALKLAPCGPGHTSTAAIFTPNVLAVPFLAQTAPVIGAVVGE